MNRRSKKAPIKHAVKFVKFALTIDELKDESYIQIIKQITNCKDPAKCIRGWNMLAIVASSYVPSEKLYYSIINFLLNLIKSGEEKEKILHANYVLMRLHKTFTNGKRRVLPSESEITYIEQMKPIPVTVNFFSGEKVDTLIESYTTVRELKNIVTKKNRFLPHRSANFSLYEICDSSDKTQERFLEENQRVSDVLSQWSTDMQAAAEKKEHIEFKMFIKCQIFYQFSDQDDDSVFAIYNQTIYDVNTGKFNLDEKNIISLASIQLLAEFGGNKQKANQDLTNNIEKYIPSNHNAQHHSVYWQQKIMELYSNFDVVSSNEAKLNYLDIIKKNHLWQAQQFDVKVSLIINIVSRY